MTQSRTLVACPVCQSTQLQPHLTKNGYALQRCTSCGHIFVNPMPSDAELQAHYQNPAYYEGEEDQGYRNYEDMHRALKPHFERRLRQIETRLPQRGRLLDFGCADGYFLDLSRPAGWQVYGVELSKAMGDRASQRLGITVHDSLDALAESGFDAITLWEVIEHVPRPIELLTQFGERLRSGGVLMLSTPNTDHWQAKRARDVWSAYRPPSHLQYFSGETMRRALERAGFGDITVNKVMPLPPMPAWLESASRPIYARLKSGQMQRWSRDLWLWRAIRAGAWAWQKIAHPADDIFTTLEVLAIRP